MRIKINIPERPSNYSSKLVITVQDLNYGNHLGNDRLLAMAHETRLRYFNKIKQTELSFFHHGLIMADSAIQYLSQGYWNDEIKSELWTVYEGGCALDIYYQLTKINDQKVLAKIKTGMVFFDYESQRPVKPHTEFLNFIDRIN